MQVKGIYHVLMLISNIKRTMIEYLEKRNSITIPPNYWTTTLTVVWVAK